jgi:hypothetical protein
MRCVAVVREQQESAGFLVESSDGIDAFDASRQEVDHRFPTRLVTHGRDNTPRFVQDPVGRPFADQSLAVDSDLVYSRIGAVAELCDAPIDRDAFVDQELLGIAAGTEASGREEFLKPDRARDSR